MRPVVVGGVLVVIVACSLAAFLVAAPIPANLATDVEPLIGLVSQNETRLREGAQLKIEISDSPEILASGLSGRVVEVFLRPGDTIEHGSEVAQVDERTVIAFRSESPFWRPLKLGDSGGDVAQLQCGLRDLGYISDEELCDGKFGRVTQAAVRDLNLALGLGNVGTFDPSIALWLPLDTSVATEVLVQQGDWFPGQATPVIRLAPEVVAAEVVMTNPVRFDPGIFGALTFTSDVTGELGIQQDLSLGIEVASQVAASIPADAAAPNVLETSGFVDGAELRERMEVPTAAIVEDASGSCVISTTADGLTPVAVTVIGSSVTGVSYVDGDLAINDEILLNPSDLGSTSC